MRLRYVTVADFKRSELTNFRNLMEEKKLPKRMSPDDVVLLVSKGEDQLVFIHGFDTIDGHTVLYSTRLRLSSKSRWNPLFLVKYARQVGIRIEGLQVYEDFFKKLVDG